jgi:hypothetical protein
VPNYRRRRACRIPDSASARLATLAPHHPDPFDWMLVAQALAERAAIVSHDRQTLARPPPVPYTDPVDAGPLLGEIGRRLREVNLDAVLIGNAAAALQGAPVTTVDFDSCFERRPNLTKLKALARGLRATILRPYYPVSDLYRLVRDDDGLQLDFMATIHGLRSYEGVRDRAAVIEVGGVPVRVASLADIIKSKRAAGRPRDLAVLDVLETALEEAPKPPRPSRRARPRKPT